jgi:two-component system cell cycle sensor histidine kinase/response regulator CckA
VTRPSPPDNSVIELRHERVTDLIGSRELVERLPLVVYVDDVNDHATGLYVSPQLEPLLGYAPEEWLADPRFFEKTLHPDDRERVLANVAEVNATRGVFRDEYRLVAKDGRTVWVHDESIVVTDDAGRPLYAHGYLLDVTARREMENALRASEERFHGAFDASAIGMALTAPDGRFLEVNAALSAITGYGRHELLEMRFDDLTHPDDLEDDRRSLQELRTGVTPVHVREKRALHRSGATIWVNVIVTLVRDANGRPLHFVTQVQDVTEQRRADDLAEQLRQAQKMEAVGRLAGGIAHDFNNLLTAISGYADFARERAEDEILRADIQEIRRAAGRATALTRQLLAFSRRQTLAPQLVNVTALVGDVATMLGRLIGEHVPLEIVLDEDVHQVMADPGQLEQVLLNLVLNARDAMPEGGTITIVSGMREVGAEDAAVHGVEAGPYVALAVNDTGEGIDPSVQSQIFDPFFTTKEQGKGTGLGLATVYGAVSQSGGFVTVESAVGVGSSFTVHLPSAGEGASPTEVFSGVPGGTETILLVEDEQVVRKLARTMLEGLGYTVVDSDGPQRALQLVQDGLEFDLLVTDVVMPGMDGSALVERLTGGSESLAVLYMSGYPPAQLRGPSGAEPVTLAKPFSVATLAQKVRAALDGAGERPHRGRVDRPRRGRIATDPD